MLQKSLLFTFLILNIISCSRTRVDNSVEKIVPDSTKIALEMVNKGVDLLIEVGVPTTEQDTIKLKQALYYFDKAINGDRTTISAYINKVDVLCLLKKYREAIYVLNRLTQLRDSYAEAYSYKGFIFEKLGIMDTAMINYTKAVDSYNSRIKKNPNISDKVNRAFLLYFTDGEDTAWKEFEFILKNHPNDSTVNNMKLLFEKFDRKEFIDGI